MNDDADNSYFILNYEEDPTPKHKPKKVRKYEYKPDESSSTETR
jgi:hypothetical protein